MMPREAFQVLPELLAALGARTPSEVTPTSMQPPGMELTEPQFSRNGSQQGTATFQSPAARKQKGAELVTKFAPGPQTASDQVANATRVPNSGPQAKHVPHMSNFPNHRFFPLNNQWQAVPK